MALRSDSCLAVRNSGNSVLVIRGVDAGIDADRLSAHANIEMAKVNLQMADLFEGDNK